jgi:ribonuclease R
VAKPRDSGFPARDAIVAFIRAHSGEVGTREIAREFGLKNADRAELKRILRLHLKANGRQISGSLAAMAQ